MAELLQQGNANRITPDEVKKLARLKIEEDRERQSQLRAYYTDPNHGLSEEDNAKLNRLFRQNPEEKSGFFNSHFFSNVTGLSLDQVRARQPELLRAYSEKYLGEAIESDSAFYDRIRESLLFESALSQDAMEAGLINVSPIEAGARIASVVEANRAQTVYAPRAQEYEAFHREQIRKTSERLAKYRPTIDWTVETLRERMGVEGADGAYLFLDEVAEELLDEVEEKDFDIVLQAIIANAGDVEEKNYFKRLGENFARGSSDIVENALFRSKLNPFYNRLRGDLIDARKRVAQGIIPAMTLGDAQEIAERSIPGRLGEGRSELERYIEVDPEDESVQAALALLDREIKKQLLIKKLTRIEEQNIDPATSESMAGRGFLMAARSLPYTVSAFSPVTGFAINSASLSEEAFDRLGDLNPDMDIETRHNIAMATGPIAASFEQVTPLLLTGKLPSLGQLMNRVTLTKGSVAARAGIRIGEATALEMLQENAQDFTPYVIQSAVSALREDVPTVPWDDIFDSWWHQQGELFFAVLPLSLIGGGAGTYQDFANSRALMSNAEGLRLLGIDEASAVEIAELGRQDKLDEAQVRLREEFGKGVQKGRNLNEVRQEAAQKLFNQVKQTEETIERAEELDILPGMRRTEEGVSLTFADGTSRQYKTHSEATAAREEYIKDKFVDLHEDVRATIAQVERQLEEGREVRFVFSPGERNLLQAVEEGEVTREAALNRLGIASQQEDQGVREDLETEYDIAQTSADLQSMTEDERLSKAAILGKNVTEFAEGIYKTTSTLYRGYSPLTVVEEKSEGDAQVLLDNGKRDWLISKIRGYETVSGDSVFLTGKADEDLTTGDIKEAFSALVQSYFVGKTRKGEVFGGAEKGNFRKLAADMMRSGLGSTMESYAQFFRSVWRRAAKLNKLRREGKLDAELEQELARSVGMSEQAQYEADVLTEAEKVKTELEEGGVELEVDESTFEPTDDAPFSVITMQQDAEYMAAVESGDMETAQRMVDEAAKAAGASPKLFRGDSQEFNVFDPELRGESTSATGAERAFFFTESESDAKSFASIATQGRGETVREFYLFGDSIEKFDTHPNSSGAFDGVDQNQTSYVVFNNIRDTADEAVFLDVAVDGERVYIDPRGILDELVDELGEVDSETGLVTNHSRLSKELEDIIAAELEEGYDKGNLQKVRESYPELFKLKEAADNKRDISLYTPENIKVYAAFNPNQIKSADPVTRDADGNVIPLSQRFDQSRDEIGFSVIEEGPGFKQMVMPDGARLEGPASFSIVAFHGTAAKVDRFSTDKIGTGHGAQAYGWGLYFAEEKEVAAEYIEPPGNLYKVELDANQEDFLDWDVPLMAQSEKVRELLIDLQQDDRYRRVADIEGNIEELVSDGGMDGMGLYDILVDQLGDAEAASAYLDNVGIKGIRFLDEVSRRVGEGTSNYVIFDENLVKILQENGQETSYSVIEGGASQDLEGDDQFDPFKKWKETPEEEVVPGTPGPDTDAETIIEDPDGEDIPWKDSTGFSLVQHLPETMPISDSDLQNKVLSETDTIGMIDIDRMRVGEYDGVMLQGGMFFPTIVENLEQRVVWAFNSVGVANSVLNKARKNGGYIKLVLMTEGNVVGNKTFATIWMNQLERAAASDPAIQEEFIQQLHTLRKSAIDKLIKQDRRTREAKIKKEQAKENKAALEEGRKPKKLEVKYREESEIGKYHRNGADVQTLDDARKFLIDMPQIQRGQFYFQRTTQAKATANRAAGQSVYGLLLSENNTTKFNFPNASEIVENIEEPAFKGLPKGSVVGLIKIDPDQEVMTGEQAGVTPHISYEYVLKGEPVARMRKIRNIEEDFPQLKFPMQRAKYQYPAGSLGFSVIENAEERIADMFSPFQRSPVLRHEVGARAHKKVIDLLQQFRPVFEANRTPQEINEEARRVEEEKLAEFLDGISPATVGALEFSESIDDVAQRPILAELTTYRTITRKDGKVVRIPTGSLMGKTRAKKEGRSTAEYDDMPEGLPSYVFGGNLSPDQAAQQTGFDDVAEFFSALEAEVNSFKSAKSAAAAARREVAGFSREAREAGRARKAELLKEKKIVGSDKKTLLGALRMLDAVVSSLPMEIRGKIGGVTTIAQMSSPRVMLNEIERRVNIANEVLERYLVKEADAALDKLLKRIDRTKDTRAGKKAKSRLDQSFHTLVDAAKTARNLLTSEQGEMEAEKQEVVIRKIEETDVDALSDEKKQQLVEDGVRAGLLAEIYRAFAGWKDLDASQRHNAVKLLSDLFNGAWINALEREAKKRERYEALRAEAITSTNADSSAQSRKKKKNEVKGKRKGILGLQPWEFVVSYLFGDNSEIANYLADGQRKADNDLTDAMQAVEEDFDTFVKQYIERDTVKAGKILTELDNPTIETDEGTYSELEAIDILLTWNQEDGRRHMEGHKDEETGKPNGDWHYGAEFVKLIEEGLSDTGKMILSFLQSRYSQEYERLNPLYRKLNGIDMPKNKFYAPIFVTPIQSNQNEQVDPNTGMRLSANATPGALRTRSGAIAEPEFQNGLEKYFAHKREMEHWLAYSEFSLEANAIFGNRKVRNAIEAKAGKEAINTIGEFTTMFTEGGTRAAGVHLGFNQIVSKMSGNFAMMALWGRLGTIAIQVTQLAAAQVEMSMRSYSSRMFKLFTGQLNWRAAIESDYIQRRLKEQPAVVRFAMDELAKGKPTRTKYLSQKVGQLIGGADALFTAGTFAVVYDYRLAKAKENGLEGSEAEAFALNEAERLTDRLAQPTRPGAKSIIENTLKSPIARLAIPFFSEARKNISLMIQAQLQKGFWSKQMARATFYAVVANGLISALIRNAWRDLRDDEDDEIFDPKHWRMKKIIASVLTDWIYGVPALGEELQNAVLALLGETQPQGGPFSSIPRAVYAAKKLDEIEDIDDLLRKVEAIMTAFGLFNDQTAAATVFMHPIRDGVDIITNLIEN